MRNVIALVVAAGLAASVMELALIHGSPLLGDADVGLATSEAGNPGMTKTGGLYGLFYENRPRSADPYRTVYQLRLTGLWMLDSTMMGVGMWDAGLFNPCGVNATDAYARRIFVVNRPAARASQMLPVERMTGGMEFVPGLGGGKAVSAMGLGWLILWDFTGTAPQILFEDKCPRRNNMSFEEVRSGIVKTYGVYNARSAFLESVLDGGKGFEGIEYFAYYPSYNMSYMLTYNIPRDSLEKSEVYVDGVRQDAQWMHPFAFIRGGMADGQHELTLKTRSGEYGLAFKTDTSPFSIEPVATGITYDGRLVAVMGPHDREVTLRRVEATAGGAKAERDMDVHLEWYNLTMVDLDFGRPLPEDFYDVDLRVAYDMDGSPMWHNSTMLLQTE